MVENKKAAEILSIYQQLRRAANDVTADLLFSTAVNLACPWHTPLATATGIATMGGLAQQQDAAEPDKEAA